MERKGNQKNLSHSLAQCTPLANAGQTGVQPTTLTALSLNADGKMWIQTNTTIEMKQKRLDVPSIIDQFLRCRRRGWWWWRCDWKDLWVLQCVVVLGKVAWRGCSIIWKPHICHCIFGCLTFFGKWYIFAIYEAGLSGSFPAAFCQSSNITAVRI